MSRSVVSRTQCACCTLLWVPLMLTEAGHDVDHMHRMAIMSLMLQQHGIDPIR